MADTHDDEFAQRPVPGHEDADRADQGRDGGNEPVEEPAAPKPEDEGRREAEPQAEHEPAPEPEGEHEHDPEPQGSSEPESQVGHERTAEPQGGHERTAEPQGNPKPAPEPPVVESASATTSKDNRAGAGPYVIVGCVLAGLLVVGLGVAGAITSIGSVARSSTESGYADGPDAFDDEDFPWGDGGSGWNAWGGSNTRLDADNVFDYELGCLDASVSDYVFATDYAGSQEAVATYVKALAKLDEEATKDTLGHLRAAAGAKDDATRADELGKAAQRADDARSAALSLSVDASKVTGPKAADIVEDLGDAREDVAERWEDVGKIVGIMREPDGHRVRDLEELDDSSGDVTDIAIELTDALSDSASAK